MGLQIEGEPRYITGRKIVDVYSVPGRNGSLLFDTGAFSDGTAEYKVSRVSSTLEADLYKIATWLMNTDTWKALTDTQEPLITRYAYCDNALDFVRKLKLTGAGTIHFACKPQRYFTANLDTLQGVTSGGTIVNDYMPARPILYIAGSGAATLAVNDTTITFTDIDTSITVDCENCIAYKGSTNLSNKISINKYDYPVLKNGNNVISWTGGITGVNMKSRLWTL